MDRAREGAGADRRGPGQGGLTRVVVRGAAWSGAGFITRNGLSFATSLVLARLVTPSQYGAFLTGIVVVEFGTGVAGSGMLAALIQRRDRMEEAANTALIATVLGGIALGLLLLAAAPLIGDYVGSADVTRVAQASSGLLVLGTATIVPDALLQRRFSFVRRVIVEPVIAVTYAAVAIAACAAGMGTWGLVLGTYCAATAGLVCAWTLVRWRPRPRLATLRCWRELARFSRHIVAAGALERIVALSPVALLGRAKGPAQVGAFGYAWRMAALPRTAGVDVGAFVLLPAFASIADEPMRLRAAVERSLRVVCTVMTPVSLLLLPLGPPLVTLLFGERWRAAGPALAALCLFSAGMAVVDVAIEVLKVTNRPARILLMIGGHAALAVSLTAVLAPVGLTAVAAGLSASAVAGGAYALVVLRRAIAAPLGPLLAAVLVPLVAAGVMVGVVGTLERLVVQAGARGPLAGLPLLGAEAAIGAAVYLAVLARMRPGDVAAILRLLRRRRGAARARGPG